jgi:hypothetical protein
LTEEVIVIGGEAGRQNAPRRKGDGAVQVFDFELRE